MLNTRKFTLFFLLFLISLSVNLCAQEITTEQGKKIIDKLVGKMTAIPEGSHKNSLARGKYGQAALNFILEAISQGSLCATQILLNNVRSKAITEKRSLKLLSGIEKNPLLQLMLYHYSIHETLAGEFCKNFFRTINPDKAERDNDIEAIGLTFLNTPPEALKNAIQKEGFNIIINLLKMHAKYSGTIATKHNQAQAARYFLKN
jgi:hypothetical protein